MREKIYKRYASKTFNRGPMPSKFLKTNIKKFKPGKALDIGCGKGRNAIFLSTHKFTVEAIDKDAKEIKKLINYMGSNKVTNIKPEIINILNYKFKPSRYGLIIAIHSLDFLKLSEIRKLIKKIKVATKKGGVIYFSVFSVKDPTYNKIAKKREEIEKNTFFLPKFNIYRHFFTVKELKDIFNDWKIIYLKQYYKEDSHGKIKKHIHNIIEISAKK